MRHQVRRFGKPAPLLGTTRQPDELDPMQAYGFALSAISRIELKGGGEARSLAMRAGRRRSEAAGYVSSSFAKSRPCPILPARVRCLCRALRLPQSINLIVKRRCAMACLFRGTIRRIGLGLLSHRSAAAGFAAGDDAAVASRVRCRTGEHYNEVDRAKGRAARLGI